MSIIIPTILTDEIDRSYLGAVMRINGCATEREAIELMAQHVGLGGIPRREAPTLELLSKITQTDIPTFTRQHTTMPLRRGITSYLTELKHGSEDYREMLWTSGIRVARPGAYCCPKCIKADQELHGRGYWHRNHQIPGLQWCPEHRSPLLYMESEQAFLTDPGDICDSCHPVPESWLGNKIDNRFINTFLEISFALLKNEKPFSVTRVSSLLKTKNAALGFQSHPGKVKAPLLSDAVISRFGREWLGTVLPPLANKQNGKILSQMDGVLYLKNSASSATAYILALSLLFNTSKEALDTLAQIDIAEPLTTPCKSNQKIKNDELRSAYLNSHGNYAKTANLLGTSYAAICGRLRNIGLPNLRGANLAGLEKASLAFFIEGKSFADSVTIGSITCDALENLARVAGPAIVGLFKEMKVSNSGRGRGSGIRRPLLLNPHEVDSATGHITIKFNPHLRREQKLRLREGKPPISA